MVRKMAQETFEKFFEKLEGENKENNFKQTEIGLIPEDWEVVRLGEVFKEVNKKERKIKIEENRIYRLVHTKLYAQGVELKEEKKGKQIKADYMFIVKQGDFIFSKINAKKGAFGIISSNLDGAVVTSEHPILITNERKAFNYFVFYYLSQPKVWDEFEKHSIGFAGKSRIKVPGFLSVKIPLPPLEEQRKIVRVLDKIQQAIELQDRIIEQAKRLKKSLMQKLFTEGLYGEEQKETEIGLIPKSWEVVRLEEIGKIITGNTPSKRKKEYWENGEIDFIKPPDLKNSYITTFSEKISLKAKDKARIVPEKSILVSCIGIIGRVGYTLKPVAFNQQINAIIPFSDKIDSLFLFFALQTQVKQIESMKSATTVPIVNKAKFSHVKIPLPSLEEQKQIAHILSTIDRKIEVEQKRKQVLKELFKTMLHKLMSGEIRLKVVEI